MSTLMPFIPRLLMACTAALISAPALAGPVFFGTDATPANTVPAAAPGSSLSARNAFSIELATSAGISFEGTSFPVGSVPTAAQPQSVLGGTGTMFRNNVPPGSPVGDTRIQSTLNASPNAGRFNTTSATSTTPIPGQWWETSASFTLTLGSLAQAIGFYGTDFGDFKGSLTLDLFNGNDEVLGDLVVPRGSGSNGSLIFYGFANSAVSFNRVVFNIAQLNPTDLNSYDLVGFDDLIVGTVQGTAPPPTGVPEPGTLALAALSLGLLARTRRRRG